MTRLLSWIFLVIVIPAVASGGSDSKDPKNWTPVKITGEQKAPEFADVAEWINSPPVTIAELKGKVVVVHFMAFG